MRLPRWRISALDTSVTSGQWAPSRVADTVRVLTLVMTFGLALASSQRSHALAWYPLLLLGGVLGSWRQVPPQLARFLRILEALAAAGAIYATASPTSPLFPYLIAPSFAAGLLTGVTGAAIIPSVAAIMLVSLSPSVDGAHDFVANIAEWFVLSLAAGLLAAWVRRLLAPLGRSEPDSSYAAAYRLLAQLRPVARQLSVGLDPGTIAQTLLQGIQEQVEFERGAVYVRSGSARLVQIATVGASRLDWDVDVAGDGPFADAWLSQRAQRVNRQLSGPPGSALIIPLVIGLRSFGLVGFETVKRRLGPTDASTASELAAETALRLETALLFDEVRGVATAEERRRVAREIHDGIAQELSYIGYFVDGLAAEARGREDPMEEQLHQLRSEITRIVSELRLSIFDLRSEVDVHGGLGSALSEYVRTVGRQSGFTVHLSLDESPNRLPAETEAELLRIAQEAITNARKHAEAQNLWVSLTVDPPGALLRVEDDGRGLGRARIDSYGLQIMRERASRLRTTVNVHPREPKGTTVEVRLGATEKASLSQDAVPLGDGLKETTP